LVIGLGGALGLAVPSELGLGATWSLAGAVLGGAFAVAGCAYVLTRTVGMPGPESLLASGFAAVLALVVGVALTFIIFERG
jgi:hypothetical protein